jgi:hypothetical protein
MITAPGRFRGELRRYAYSRTPVNPVIPIIVL